MEKRSTSKTGRKPRKLAESSELSEAAPRPRELSVKQIAARAYQIWEAEGRPVGRELQHWLRAEAELRG